MDAFFKKKCSDNKMVDFLIEGKYRFWRHALVWVYVFFFFILTKDFHGQSSGLYWLKSCMWNMYFLSMFYFNMYVLVPKVLFRENYVGYFILLTMIIVGSYLGLVSVSEHYLNGYVLTRSDEFDRHAGSLEQKIGSFKEFAAAVHMIVLMVFASTSIKLFQRWARDARRIGELETNSLQMELRELRNQVNPHFLFNMLNNVNVLVRKNPDQAIATIHKLSDFLRYQLYENHSQSVLLLPEIQFLNDLLELEKMRRDDFTFSLKMKNDSANPDKLTNLMLPPNLFISFVENAIKHSADADNPTNVEVSFTITDDSLVFKCSNSKPEEIRQSKTGGLGLANIKRRLELLYADTYHLGISEDKSNYSLTLTLPI